MSQYQNRQYRQSNYSNNDDRNYNQTRHNSNQTSDRSRNNSQNRNSGQYNNDGSFFTIDKEAPPNQQIISLGFLIKGEHKGKLSDQVVLNWDKIEFLIDEGVINLTQKGYISFLLHENTPQGIKNHHAERGRQYRTQSPNRGSYGSSNNYYQNSTNGYNRQRYNRNNQDY